MADRPVIMWPKSLRWLVYSGTWDLTMQFCSRFLSTALHNSMWKI